MIAESERILGTSDAPRLDAEVLIAAALGLDRGALYRMPEHAIGGAELSRCRSLVQERARGVPVAYLCGHREFWSLDLRVDRSTLIPRPETELLVELALDTACANAAIDAVDLGTGSGAIALALAHERPRWRIAAVDVSPAALACARANASRLGIERIEWLSGDWFAPLAGRRFDLVVANPPYVAENDPHLEGDLSFEPRLALASGTDGLDAIRAIVAAAPAYLRPDGRILIEHGWTQGTQVRTLLARAGLVQAGTVGDLAGRERCTHARLPAAASDPP
ncbi:MAG: peptide chain release factor N(5)-glutamine methyltransferase [Gammaproteobacteria bacterium]